MSVLEDAWPCTEVWLASHRDQTTHLQVYTYHDNECVHAKVAVVLSRLTILYSPSHLIVSMSDLSCKLFHLSYFSFPTFTFGYYNDHHDK